MIPIDDGVYREWKIKQSNLGSDKLEEVDFAEWVSEQVDLIY